MGRHTSFLSFFLAFLVMVFCTTAFSQWTECDDFVFATVEGGSITVHHLGALYNCCPDPFAYSVEQDGGQIVVTETEVLSDPCLCLCCFDLSVEIEDVAPGAYELVLRWFDYGGGGWLEWSLDVNVLDGGQAGPPQIVDSFLSDCYSGPTAVPDDPILWPRAPEKGTWGTVKSLYR